MARLQKIEGPVNPTAETAIALVGQVILFGSSNQTACQVSDFVGMILTAALRVLPSVIVSVMQALPTCGHDLLLEGLLKVPVSFWTLIFALAGRA
jgi:hypothetical protein